MSTNANKPPVIEALDQLDHEVHSIQDYSTVEAWREEVDAERRMTLQSLGRGATTHVEVQGVLEPQQNLAAAHEAGHEVRIQTRA